MHFPTLTTITTLLFGFALASPATPPATPPTFPEGTAIPFAPVSNTPPGHINAAPYGHPDTYFHGLAEAQRQNHTLATRNVAGVYGCSQENWHGMCTYTVASGGLCHAWPWGVYSSFGPDHGIYCVIYAGGDCLGQGSGRLHYPGLSAVENVMQEGAQSYRCHWA